MDNLQEMVSRYWMNLTDSFPPIRWVDIVEILLLAVVIYEFMLWIKHTRAYSLLKGILVILAVVFIAYLFEMHTILWIAENSFGVAVTAIVIIFHPELRKILEQLGHKNFLSSLLPFDSSRQEEEVFSNRFINEIVRACFEMGEARTGALIVIERKIGLNEYAKTGIELDSLVTSQLLLNIFEHNTPLHDGAVIIRGDRILAATCYLPLSDNLDLSKKLGTRHRAGVGISEVTDSLTIIVSEETGGVSVANNGELQTGLDAEALRKILSGLQKVNTDSSKFKIWKGRVKNEEKSDE
ncbi:MAG: diadenylate cyclase CdaA [Lachnospiraceae bacterium]|jgi:diadenylate cyclase